MSNLLIDGVIQNPSLAELKKEFPKVDFESYQRITINKKYFNVNDGVTDITKIAVEPVYNRVIDGRNSSVRCYDMVMERGNPPQKTYSPDVITFGKYGSVIFDFENDTNVDYALFRWLMLHPQYGSEWKLDEPVVEATNWIEEEKNIQKVRNMFLTQSATYIDDKMLLTVATNMQVANPSNISLPELRKTCYERAVKNPKEFIQLYGSKDFQATGLIQEAVDLKCIYFDKGRMRWFYTYAEDSNDVTRLRIDAKNAVYQIKPHMQNDPIADFARFLSEDDQNGHIAILQKTIEARKHDINKHPDKRGDGPVSLTKFAGSKIQVVLD